MSAESDPASPEQPAHAAVPPAAGNSAAPSAPGGAAMTEAEQALLAAQARANENYDLFLRAKADAENARRRAQEDLAKAHKYAIEAFAEALVPVMDSLEKALEAPHAAEQGGADSLRVGVEITLRQLRAAFEKNRLVEINPLGEKFDPHRHQAISMVAPQSGDGAVAPNHVVAVLQKGWLIADRVLRPAMVSVARAS